MKKLLSWKTLVTAAVVLWLLFLIFFWRTRHRPPRSAGFDPDINSLSKPQSIVSLESFSQLQRKQPKKIAYIFAGSARSFICPRVHWSIKFNALDAFGGEPYTFVRISTEDNQNVRTGTGKVFSPKYNEQEINETLKLLNPRVVEYFTLAHEEEDMKKHYPGTAHRVFRENDRRRYSMFFHRCMGYKLVLNYERAKNIKFDWVVLIRLDTAWSGPVHPIDEYSNDRVWLTETGFVPFNDQFMLIPRAYSDYLFDLNTKVQKKVYCIGGPDVEKWKCNATHLLLSNEGRNTTKVHETLSYCCPDVFDQNNIGYSESIHYRHLFYGKIPIGFSKFLVYITRYTNNECRPDCDRLLYNFKRESFQVHQRNYSYYGPMNGMDTRGSAVSLVDTAQCYAQIHPPSSIWNPIKAIDYHREANRSSSNITLMINYSRPFQEQLDVIPKNLLLPLNAFTGWFIHPTHNIEGCMTYNDYKQEFSWEDCLVHIRHRLGYRHNPHQTWLVSVLPHQPPNRINSVFYRHQHPFETIRSDSRYFSSNNSTRIMMVVRRDIHFLFTHARIKCLSANWEKSTVAILPCVNSYEKDPSQWFTVVGEGPGSHPFTTIAKMRLAVNSRFCISRGGQEEERTMAIYLKPGIGKLRVTECDAANPQTLNFEFELLQ
jgi:hypothetical protein